ncbi:hypothetical protein Ancab_024756 [Ancistrocladus abbreviatus]
MHIIPRCVAYDHGIHALDARIDCERLFCELEEGHKVVRCDGQKSLERAKSLVNIEFSWCLILLSIFAVSFYLLMVKIYGDNNKEEYFSILSKEEEEEEEEEEDVEAQKENKFERNAEFYGLWEIERRNRSHGKVEENFNG